MYPALHDSSIRHVVVAEEIDRAEASSPRPRGCSDQGLPRLVLSGYSLTAKVAISFALIVDLADIPTLGDQAG